MFTSVDDFRDFGVRAVVTTRAAGDFALNGNATAGSVLARWEALRSALGVAGLGSQFATANQVHGVSVLAHDPGWTGWLRVDEGDAHFADRPGIGLGVTIADCVPVFFAHPRQAIALAHAGWRGTASGIVRRVVPLFRSRGMDPAELRVHLGPAICGKCYEVGPDVYAQLTGTRPDGPRTVDLRAILAEQLRGEGVRHLTTSRWCTRCHNDVYFSHRAGDAERQVAAIVAEKALTAS